MTDLAARLAHWAELHGVPGAQLCISDSNGCEVFCHGFANQATGAEVTEATRFQIGSVTKPMLAFIAQRLADDGRLDLDAQPAAYLGTLADRAPLAAPDLRVRHLMDHSSGLAGDLFLDLGEDERAAGALLKAAEAVAPLHAVGAEASYCNFAYVVLGEIISAVMGAHWTSAFRTEVCDVIGSTTLDPWPPADAPELAVGHDARGPVERTHLAISNAAAGTTPVGTAADLAAFGRVALRSLNGDGPLAPNRGRAMTELSAKLAPNERGLGFGQGFMVMNWSGKRVFGHDGLTISQRAFLRVFPETGVSVGLLGNGGDLRGLYEDLFADLASLTGASPPPRLSPTGEDNDWAKACGRFDRPNASLRISRAESGLQIEILNHEPWAELAYSAIEGPFPLKPCGPECWMFLKPGSDVPLMVCVRGAAAYHGMRRYNRSQEA